MDRKQPGPPGGAQTPLYFPGQPGQGAPRGGPPQGMGADPGPQAQQGQRVEFYYTNCAAVMASPKEISVFFGRYIPVPSEGRGTTMAPLYEKQILMTVEQALELVGALKKAVDDFQVKRAQDEVVSDD